ncbi:unnamed protein product [Effrenium voratum]|nr:unnamed protein product [Effrenium voratum]CAJ1419172.1 unnamed protein product [Effrenium voratum]
MAGAGRHRGVVKFFRGSYGWLTCGEVAEKTGGRDIFLHKNQLNSVPGPGTTVEFSLTIDEKGQPKAVDAVVIGAKPTSPAPAGDVKKASEMQVKRAALMLFRGEEVLVIKEKKEGELLWSDLGGKIEAGESHLDCAVRELAEEAEGFLSAESVALLQQGLRRQYGDGQQSPQLVALRGTGSKPQAVAVFPLDCSGVEMDVASARNCSHLPGRRAMCTKCAGSTGTTRTCGIERGLAGPCCARSVHYGRPPQVERGRDRDRRGHLQSHDSFAGSHGLGAARCACEEQAYAWGKAPDAVAADSIGMCR